MKKKTIANLIMVAVILVIVAAGVLSAGHIQGWFDKADADVAILTGFHGIINLERGGVAYPVEEDTVLRAEDRITCDPGATVAIRAGENQLTLGEYASVEITSPTASDFTANVTAGEVFVSAANPVTLCFDGKDIRFEETVASLSVRSGAQSISVFAGNVEGADAGQMLDWVGQTLNVTELSIESLNEFHIKQIRLANESKTLCFTNAELDKLETERRIALQDMTEETLTLEKESAEESASTVTLNINCDTILDNWGSFDQSKAGYVPSNGVILTSTVEITEGETVFSVLQRACTAFDIQLEYSWTPMHDSYYVEGINNLYEFDCGPESGWIYKVNGWSPNYGSSSYTLTGGENIVWYYTCVGLGADIGG